MIPTEPKKIRAYIRQIERKFEKEPHYRDGSGSRFLLGPLYVLMSDTEGALKHYEWFEKTFPDSIDEPSAAACWALAMYRAGRGRDAVLRLRRAYLANPYYLPALIGLPHGQPDVWRGCNWEHEDYVADSPAAFKSLWTDSERAWLEGVWLSPEFSDFVQTHINLSLKLEKAEGQNERGKLIEQLYALRRSSKPRPTLALV